MRTLDKLAWDWALRCFGQDHVFNIRVRALRLAEEAIEIAQSTRVNREMMHDLVNQVYDRPAGDMYQEVGGVCMTLSVLCTGMGIDRKQAFTDELKRCLAKPTEHFAKRNLEKIQC